MSDEDLEKSLKDFLFNTWKNNHVFRDNINFLTQVPLKTLPREIMLDTLERTEDFYYHDLSHATPPPGDSELHILDIPNTIDLILENPKSFCRYGDGELRIMVGSSQHFQPYHEDLGRRLREIIESSNDKCYVGIDGRYFTSTVNYSENFKRFSKINGLLLRSLILKYCNRKRLYINAAFTCLHDTFNFDVPKYAELTKKLKELFRGRNLVIFCGQTVFDKIKYDIFEFAAKRTYVFAQSINAWNQYEEIMAVARDFPKEKSTLCFILGPTATVVAYDLAQEGYTAWDIGHIAKEYDAYMKYLDGNKNSLEKFFAPD